MTEFNLFTDQDSEVSSTKHREIRLILTFNRRFLSPKTLYRAGAMVLLLATLLKRQDLITRE